MIFAKNPKINIEKNPVFFSMLDSIWTPSLYQGSYSIPQVILYTLMGGQALITYVLRASFALM